MRRRIAKKIEARKKAESLIPELLKKSKMLYKEGDKRLSKTYSKKIRYLYMKHKIKLPRTIKRQLCRNCYGVLIPGLNCRTRTKDGKLIIYCLDCKKYTRIVLK
ncbi:hypothetical protein KY358_00820 [Candidatus Woesearchaeota archaeon]|nr:hypothetical protein [Candidatus Woesearchaeota archaeon]